MIILYLIIGILIGGIIGLLAGFAAKRKAETALAASLEREHLAETRIEELKLWANQRLEEAKKAAADNLEQTRKAQAEEIRREREEYQRSLTMQKETFSEAITHLNTRLELATKEMLKAREAEFAESNGKIMADIVAPLNAEIERMRESMSKNTEKHTLLSGTLSESIRLLMRTSESASKSADRLAGALSMSNRVQGHWGETILAQLLTSQGLVEGVHFDTQLTMTDLKGNTSISEEGSAMRPDVILHLDDNRDVVIDSKVSLTAYLDFVNAETESQRDEALKRHIESIQTQVRLLSRKDYTKYVTPPKRCMDYVIMFVPVSAALHAATQCKPDLWRRAMEQNVYIADEQTLYAALRIIDMTWRNIAQAQNHKKVYDLAAEMLDRVAVFLESFDEMGRKLNDAQDQYSKSVAKLKESGQSIPTTARKLIDLGASMQGGTPKRRKALASYTSDDKNEV